MWPSASLVDEHERRRAKVAQNVVGLSHLAAERAAVGLEAVGRADSCEDAVEQRHRRLVGGHVASDVRHQADERGLAEVGRLARHVGPRDDLEVGAEGEADVVRHDLWVRVRVRVRSMVRVRASGRVGS